MIIPLRYTDIHIFQTMLMLESVHSMYIYSVMINDSVCLTSDIQCYLHVDCWNESNVYVCVYIWYNDVTFNLLGDFSIYRGPGVAIMVLSWVITFYTLWQMVEMHEMVPGKRFDRYHELGQHAFGEKLGLWVVVPLQLMCEVGVDIVYVVTGGTSIKKIYNVLYPDGKDIRSTWFYVAFGSVHFVLSHLPSFNSITAISFFAAVMSLRYMILQRYMLLVGLCSSALRPPYLLIWGILIALTHLPS